MGETKMINELYDATLVRIDAQAERIAELGAMRKRLQWATPGVYTDGNYCVLCEQEAVYGHEADCELGNLLKEVHDETPVEA